MKTSLFIIYSAFFVICFLSFQDPVVAKDVIGWAFSGAGSRIAQEAALAEALVLGLTPDGKKIIPDIIAGTSSGSLSLTALNAILSPKSKYSWSDYRDLLFGLTNGDVFDDTILGLAEIFTYNAEHGYILDTKPLRNLLNNLTNRWGFDTLGDLPIPSIICTVNKTSGDPLCVHSQNPADAKLKLVDCLMASTAIPFVFPSQAIPGITNDPIFIDGGTSMNNLPVEPLSNYSYGPKPNKMYLIAHQLTHNPGVSGIIRDIPLAYNAINALEILKTIGIYAGLEVAANQSPIKSKNVKYIPKLPETYFGLDFGLEKIQWEESMKWAKQNNPTPLNF
jgi:hypothetical protein